MASRGQVETILARLVTRGRGKGIHIIAAIQHPQADIVSGVIKANFPTHVGEHLRVQRFVPWGL